MARSLSNVVDNLAEGIHRFKCKYGHDDKKFETAFLDTQTLKMI